MAHRGLIVFQNPNARTTLERAYEEYEKALDLKAWQDPRLAALEGVLAKHDQRLKPFAGQSTKAMVIEKRWVDHPAGGGFLWRWSEGFAHDKWHVERLGYARLIVRAAIACIAAPPQGRPGRPSSIPPATPVELTDMGLKRQPILQEWSRVADEKPSTKKRRLMKEYGTVDESKAIFLGIPPEIESSVRQEALTLPQGNLTDTLHLQAAALALFEKTVTKHTANDDVALALAILRVGKRLGVRSVPQKIRWAKTRRSGSALLFAKDVTRALLQPRFVDCFVDREKWYRTPADFREAARLLRNCPPL